ncbi:archaetidylserine decarboxylase [Tenacibaculum piscium]|uniref:Phosphatidylserine decarboxylase proenzyme n=1 Tax=Tenacibaculum piscium TaxID=1458515 RepID=A0A2H1YFS7_9FLAO|nr:archaetidylserine decarboxylase [Tenacibaculum piscium]MBE7629117.1 phosphatidylserine decarboxylase [Tenacibaculum piscium]MBE7670560.1 phosphatidylserine decarboxylase [Tenacibaculum piscium]MBE7684860.1 phosphatidylserine decarboxylase [Tenacibaculum piscium]MCG8183429.1 phosphatidylserine decarboxylase [Tenacibaculum piscium]MCG8205084.1 phosphatidylserine decarboxylase [Tenacibaculum piscium]
MKIQFIDRKSGNLITETPPGEGFLKLLYHNPFGKMALLPIVKRKFLSAYYGKLMDKPNSVTKIDDFVKELDINMNEAEKSIEKYTSFNDFFYRKLKRGARPIENGFVSPGDGKMLAFENIADINNFFVKGRKFTLKEFLADDILAEKHENSSLIILRLAPNDYHRYHFPFKGIPSKMTKIKGSYFSVSPYALASNFTKVFCENKREYCILSSQEKGDIIVAPVGATMVGTIISTYQKEQPVKKGDEMGYFAFGGSTIVLIIDKNKLKIDADILKNTKNHIETFVKMGEKIGV